VDIKTIIKNNVKNHRLRVAFPTGIKAEYAAAAGHFAVDHRPGTPVRGKDGRYWPEMQTLPMQSFVDVNDSVRGIALLNNSLTEYELREDERNTLYLTLFRAMGNMIVTWWEAVGVFSGKDGSQLLRTMEFEYSIYPHEGDWKQADVYGEAEKLNVPVAMYQISGSTAGTLPEKLGFLSVEPENLILSAFKKAEDRNSYILRLFNPTAEALSGKIKLAANIKEAFITNLDEERITGLQLKAGELFIEAESNKIITVEVVI
jgi:mannosylglycerate hydrolase